MIVTAIAGVFTSGGLGGLGGGGLGGLGGGGLDAIFKNLFLNETQVVTHNQVSYI